MVGWDASSWIVWAELGSLHFRFVGSGHGTPLQKQEKGGSARASPVAAPMPKSVHGLMRDRLFRERMCFRISLRMNVRTFHRWGCHVFIIDV